MNPLLVTTAPTHRAATPERTSMARDVWVPVAIRVAEMLLQLLFVVILDRGTGLSVASRFTIWDGQLYAGLARDGYPSQIQIVDHQLLVGKEFAFFPVYPALTRTLHVVTRLNVDQAEVLVTVGSGCVLSVLVHLVVLAAGGNRRQGYVAAALIGVLPMAVVLQMGYAEGLLAAFSAGAYLAALRRRWLLAAILLLAAGLTRPVGYLAAVALPFIGLRSDPQRRLPIALATVTGLLSTPLFWVFVAVRSHRLTGWFEVEQAGWGTHFDGGRATWSFIAATVTGKPGQPGVAVCVVIAILLYPAAIAIIARRGNVAYLVMGVLSVASVLLATNYWHSKPRLLLVALLLVVPLGVRLASIRTAVLAPLVAVGLGLSAWFGGYMITAWPYAI